MKRQIENKTKIKIEKKNSSLKIYDLYIQKTEGFFIKKLKSKYIFYKQTFLSDIIKTENLYPRILFRNIYNKDELTINNNLSLEIFQNEVNINKQANNYAKENKKEQYKNINNNTSSENILNPINIKKIMNNEIKKKNKIESNANQYIQNFEIKKTSFKNINSKNNTDIQKDSNNDNHEIKTILEIKDIDIINNDLKEAVYGEKNISSKQIDIIEIQKDGNCFYRSISYFLLNTEDFYLEIKNLIIDWITNNYTQFENFFGDDEANILTKEQQAKKEFNYIQQKDSWGSHYTIAIACLLFNIDIALYIKTDVNLFKYYYLFKKDEKKNRELCIMEYQINYHFNLIYSKKIKKIEPLYDNISNLNINSNFNSSDINLKNKKLSFDYIETKFIGSKKFYDEFANFLLSIKEHENEIEKLSKQNPNMHYNQILSYCNLKYPKRLEGNNQNILKKKQTFRSYLNKYKLNENNRLCIKNPFNKEIEENLLYKIPFKNEIDLILLDAHNNYNHCGREAAYNTIISKNWYWYGMTRDIQNYINSCPLCNNKDKFKKLKGKSKIIIENGPHYRYIADLWTIPKEISLEIDYKYILDIVDHFSKWYYGYLLKSKNADEVLIHIENFCELFGYPKILQTDNGGEFKNKKLENFCEKNNIKLIHSSPYHPQTNGCVEVTHKEIQKYICFEFLKDKENFNIQTALYNIIKIHNNKIHSTTRRIPRDIRDIENKEDIEAIKSEIIKTLDKKNKNKSEIDFNKFYVIDANKIMVIDNQILEIKRKKNKSNKKLLKKIPIQIISKCEDENCYLIEIKKNYEEFEEGNLYEVNINLIEEVEEDLWKKLFD